MTSTTAIRNQISELKRDIARQTAALRESRQHLHVLETQLDEIATFPVHTLPTEILAEIFVHCLPNEPKLHRDQPVPLLLSQICHRWREAALRLPALWAELAVCIVDHCGVPNHNDFSRAQLSARRLELHAKRSGIRPIKIVVGCAGARLWSGGPPHIDFPPFVEALRRHAPKIHAFKIELGSREADDLDQAAVNLDFSALQSISLIIPGPWSHLDRPFGMFASALNLRSATLDAFQPAAINLLPWAHLSEFTGHGYLPETCVEVLQLAENLQKAHFTLIPIFRRSPVRRLVHAKLEELTVHECREEQSHVLEYFELPALQTLTLVTAEYSDDDLIPPEVLSEFFHHSGANLRQLIMEGPWRGSAMNPLDALDIAEFVELRDVSSEFAMNLFAALKNTDAFLPKLSRLKIHWLPDVIRDPRIMGKVVASAGDAILRRNWRGRRGMGPCEIKSLRLTSSARMPDSPTSLRDLRTLKTEGVDVYVGTNEYSVL
ncbi:hypothetical protein C8F01DRAFT_1119332 [Mycena amicta]|nr:hypothetical protein C8F01DRAFT_1119332 [Mycena amicta]